MKMLKSLLPLFLIAALLLSSCAGSAGSTEEARDNNFGGGAASPQGTATGYDEKGIADRAVGESGIVLPPADGGATPAPDDFEKKVIKNAEMSLEVEDAQAGFDAIVAQTKALGGYVFGHSMERRGTSVYIYLQLRLPPDQIDALIDFVDLQGDLRSSNITSSDITDSYYDAQIRLGTLKKSLEKYYEFLQNSKTVQEMLDIQREINNLTAQIESYEGRLKMWDKQVAESAVTVTIIQPADELRGERDIDWTTLSWDDMVYLLGRGFKATVNTIVTGAQWIVIVAVSSAPVWAVLAVLILVLRRRSRKKAAARDNLPPAGENRAD